MQLTRERALELARELETRAAGMTSYARDNLLTRNDPSIAENRELATYLRAFDEQQATIEELRLELSAHKEAAILGTDDRISLVGTLETTDGLVAQLRAALVDPGEFEDAYMAAHPFICPPCRRGDHASHPRLAPACSRVTHSKIRGTPLYCSCDWRPEA